MGTEVRVIGLDKLLKKLNADTLTKPAQQYVITESVKFGKDFLIGRVPKRTGESASHLATSIAAEAGSISLPAKPLRFLEYGTQLHTGAGPRSHRRRTAAQWKTGTWRIKPMRFMRATYSATRKNLLVIIPKAEAKIVAEWNR